MIRIMIAEDQPAAMEALLQKLARWKEVAVAGTAGNGRELLASLETDASVHLILMDIAMPLMNGIEAAGIVKQRYPHIKIVMITVFDDDDSIFHAIRSGADSYLLKDTKSEKLYETIVDTLNGGAVMSPSIASKALQLLKNATNRATGRNAALVTLSDRETEILVQISKGFPNRVIAENLVISPFTVKRHIENIYQKLKASNRIDLLVRAREQGLME